LQTQDPETQDAGIPAAFANLESRDWQRPNPGIWGLQKIVKIAHFPALSEQS